MCFTEFIGYRCGHASLPVLRPCPLTTQSHANPVCAVRAELPIAVPWFCTACDRILHSRFVLIQEWEHRFMHERGACPCDVVFPNLMGPRVVGQNSGGTATGHDDGQGITGEGAGGEPVQRQGGSAGGRGRPSAVPQIYEETVDQNGRSRVTVRLPSLYGAEWRDDHAALHRDRTCRCALADFATYRGASTETRTHREYIGMTELTPSPPGFRLQ